MKKRNTMLVMLLAISPVLLGLCLLFGASGIGVPMRSVLMLRLNRVVMALVVGAGLACAGVVFQALLRNPLAAPSILGVSSGAGLGAAMAILTGAAAGSYFALPVAAFAGGVITLALVFALANQGGAPSVYGIILSGVIVSAMCSGVIMALVALAPVHGLHDVIWWMLGNLQPETPGVLVTVGLVTAVGCGGIWMLSPEFNAMTLGSETAHHIGIRTTRVMTLGLGLATLVTAAGVSIAGLIGFVGLIVPHVVRLLVGPDHRRLVPVSAITGGVFLALCDAVARTALSPFEPVELPVGVITAICGGPFFLVILRKRRSKGWIE